MASRSQKAFASALPEYRLGDRFESELTVLGKGQRTKQVKRQMAEVMCTRGGCRRTHIVVLGEWDTASDKIGRSCPYCFRTSKLPPELG